MWTVVTSEILLAKNYRRIWAPKWLQKRSLSSIAVQVAMPDIVTDTNSLYTHSLSIYIAEPVTKLIVWQLIATHYTHSLSIYITKADNKDILEGSL